MRTDLRRIPGVGPRTEEDLIRLGHTTVESLRDADPEALYERDCALRGGVLCNRPLSNRLLRSYTLCSSALCNRPLCREGGRRDHCARHARNRTCHRGLACVGRGGKEGIGGISHAQSESAAGHGPEASRGW